MKLLKRNALKKRKKWYKSKVIWGNVLMLIISFAGEATKMFPASKHPEIYTSIITVANILLRFTTSSKIITNEGNV